MSFFAVVLVIGALLSGGRRMVWNRWFLGGAAIAVTFEAPDLWWQAQHGWATIAMTHALSQENGGLANIATFVIGQLGLVTLALAWVWVAGLRFLWRSGRPLWRALVWAYGLLFVLFALTAGSRRITLAPRMCTCSPRVPWPLTGGCERGPAGCVTSCWRPRSQPPWPC